MTKPTAAAVGLIALTWNIHAVAQTSPPLDQPQPALNGAREVPGNQQPEVPSSQQSQEPTTQNTDLGKPPWEWHHITDDWMGLRPAADEKGIIFAGSINGDFSKNFSGGLNTNGYNFGNLLDLSLTFDLDKLAGIHGASVFVDFQNENGHFASDDVGDLQGLDGIAADGRTQLSSVYYQQSLFDDHLQFRAGKFDANDSFNVTNFANDFIHGSTTTDPNILDIPSSPDTATGFQFFVEPTNFIYAGAGIFDGALQEGIETGDKGPATAFGAPADLFLIAEGGFNWKGKDHPLPGKIGVGVWRHTGTFDRFDGGTEHGTTGAYAVFNQSLFRKNPQDDDDAQGIGLFARYAWADPQVSVIEHHISAGISWVGPLPSRDSDELGFGFSTAVLSDRDGAGVNHREETAIELFYKIGVLPSISIQPDLQYVIHPGGVRDQGDSLSALLRISIDL